MTVLLSVILPVYNQEKYVAQTIESILAQTYSEFELLIHDDGSTDDSASIIRRYAAQDTRIRASYGANAGKCDSTNLLVKQAQGHWCAFLDADDEMLPERLAQQLAYHQAHPEVDATSCQCYYINKQGQHLGTQHFGGLRTVEEGREVVAAGRFARCSFTGLMTSRRAFEQSGGLRSQFWPCEDLEFCNRLLEQGFALIILPQVLMRYRLHDTAITMSKPLHTYDKIGYVMECITRRRAGQPERSFPDFLAARQSNPWWVKADRKRYNYAQIFFRNAGFALMSKEYLRFSWQIVVSSLLSPNHLFAKAKSVLRR
ncbi:glycosyltransferase family 2 protein [Hymenobacter sp. HDW8]|uniref:glycosyltransferase family 2 protein n=1 Tax=Hymenobacter sp. HDW8 TaxID=2714932 RepID=UPI00140CEEBA|nr:glycosyltransferase family 2 protein [Hymenobacter sp. HDW8]QIL75321.1 glycosyltransferase [Hymenobacter sp. HDW8]